MKGLIALIVVIVVVLVLLFGLKTKAPDKAQPVVPAAATNVVPPATPVAPVLRPAAAPVATVQPVPPAVAPPPAPKPLPAPKPVSGSGAGTGVVGSTSSVLDYATGGTALKVKRNIQTKTKSISSDYNQRMEAELDR